MPIFKRICRQTVVTSSGKFYISDLSLHLVDADDEDGEDDNSYAVPNKHHKKNGSICPPNPDSLQNHEGLSTFFFSDYFTDS